MKIAPRTPVSLSRQPRAAAPSTAPLRSTTPLPGRGVQERAVAFAGDMRSRGLPSSPPSIPARPRGPTPEAPGHRPGPTSAPVSAGTGEAGRPSPAPGFHGAVTEFKRRLIETTLAELGGNRTRAARALGLQRTYLLRLIREFAVHVPASAVPPRRGAGSSGPPAPG